LLNGKEQYDLQIKNVHEELADWFLHGWGWYAPITSNIVCCFKDRHFIKPYVKFLRNLKKRLKNEGSLVVLCGFSGFDEEFKDKLRQRS